jgi:hypothetical protein
MREGNEKRGRRKRRKRGKGNWYYSQIRLGEKEKQERRKFNRDIDNG